LSESKSVKSIRVIARQLCRDQTDAEQRLWAKLRDRQLGGIKFAASIPSARSLLTLLSAAKAGSGAGRWPTCGGYRGGSETESVLGRTGLPSALYLEGRG
jgi:hypothetical protein